MPSIFVTAFDVLPQMIERDSGQIILFGSIAGTCPVEHMSAYSASKAAVNMDARIGIGIGSIAPLAEQLGRSNGEAFILSGRGLDSLKRQYMGVFSHKPYLQQHFELLTKFADKQLQALSQKQAEALHCYWQLAEPSHVALAEVLGCSRVNATKLLNLSQYQLLEEYKLYFKQLMDES